jgi:hypothetical protein
VLEQSDICSLDDEISRQQDSAVADEKRTRRTVVARALGSWLQYLRKQTAFKQSAAAPLVGITTDGLKRTERGENVGIEFLLPILSWLDDELAVNHPRRHEEFRAGLFDRLVEAGSAMRQRQNVGGDPPQPLHRAAVGERGKRARKPARAS